MSPPKHLDVDLGGPFMTSAPWSAWEHLAREGARVRKLSVYMLPEGREADAVEILRTVPLGALRTLSIDLSPLSFDALVDRELPSLRSVRLADVQEDGRTEALLVAPWLRQLQKLRLDAWELVGRIEVLGPCVHLEELVLDLMEWDGKHHKFALTPGDVRELAALPALKRLDICLSRVTPEVVAAMVETRLAERVQVEVEAEEGRDQLSEQEIEQMVWAARGLPGLSEVVRQIGGMRAWDLRYDVRFADEVEALRGLATAAAVSFREVYLRVAWLHPRHRAEASRLFAGVQNWRPGPIDALGMNHLHDPVGDRVASDADRLLPWLTERIVALCPEAADYLDALAATLELEPRGKEPHPGAARLKPQGRAPEEAMWVLRPVHRFVQMCTVSDWYVRWRQQENLRRAVVALIDWEMEMRGLSKEVVRRDVETSLGVALLSVCNSDLHRLEQVLEDVPDA